MYEDVFLAFALPTRVAQQCAHLVNELQLMKLSMQTTRGYMLPLTGSFRTESSAKLYSRLVKLKLNKGLRVVTAETRGIEHDQVGNVLYLSFDGEELAETGRYLLGDLRSGGFPLERPATPKVRLASVPSGYRLPRALNLARECAPHHERVAFNTIGVYSAMNGELVHALSLAA